MGYETSHIFSKELGEVAEIAARWHVKRVLERRSQCGRLTLRTFEGAVQNDFPMCSIFAGWVVPHDFRDCMVFLIQDDDKRQFFCKTPSRSSGAGDLTK